MTFRRKHRDELTTGCIEQKNVAGFDDQRLVAAVAYIIKIMIGLYYKNLNWPLERLLCLMVEPLFLNCLWELQF